MKTNALSLHSISKEFDYEKNHPLTPESFSIGSNKKVWWVCSKNKEQTKEKIKQTLKLQRKSIYVRK